MGIAWPGSNLRNNLMILMNDYPFDFTYQLSGHRYDVETKISTALPDGITRQ